MNFINLYDNGNVTLNNTLLKSKAVGRAGILVAKIVDGYANGIDYIKKVLFSVNSGTLDELNDISEVPDSLNVGEFFDLNSIVINNYDITWEFLDGENYEFDNNTVNALDNGFIMLKAIATRNDGYIHSFSKVFLIQFIVI